jgi:alpha-beta hydrolase superfamily lysophospholipase
MRSGGFVGIAALAIAAVATMPSASVARGSAGGSVAYPAPTGRYPIGRTSLVVSTSRPEPFTASSADRRRLVVYVWYPARPGGRARPTPVFPASLARALLSGGAHGALLRLRSHAYAGAPLAGRNRLPILVMSHGDGAHPLLYSSYAEELASHGYVVAGIAHTYNALATVFPDGTVVGARPQAQIAPGGTVSATTFAQQLSLWNQSVRLTRVLTADAASVLNVLARLDRGNGRFSGRLDLGRVGIFGHSLGGAVAAQALLSDRRFRAGANLDGTLYSIAAARGLPRPFLQVTAHPVQAIRVTDAQLRQVGWTRRQFDYMARRLTLQRPAFEHSRIGGFVVVDRTEHENFGDVALLAPLLRSYRPAVGTRDPREVITIVRAYLVGFFDRHLRGAPSSLIGGKTPYTGVLSSFRGER